MEVKRATTMNRLKTLVSHEILLFFRTTEFSTTVHRMFVVVEPSIVASRWLQDRTLVKHRQLLCK
jgi:hypothetical protein